MPLRDRDRLGDGFHLDRIRYLGSAIAPLLARVGALPYDSRERLTTKEQQLAMFGISWATDAPYDAELAQELAGARRRRQADVAAAAPVHQAVPTLSVGDGLRWSLGMLLIRAGQRLQGGQPLEAAV